MIITRGHALLIQRMLEKWHGGLPLEKAVDELTDEDLEYLTHLELAGLVEEDKEGYELTQAGHLVAEALQECLASTRQADEWDEGFRFIGSEVISMIEIARSCQGSLTDQEQIGAELEKRGLAAQGRLLPVAESILQAYDISEPKIFLTPQLCEALKKSPPGPGPKSLLPFSRDHIFRLEAMRLLTFSVPYGNTFSLTGAGQQIRAGLMKGVTVDFALTDLHLFPLLEEERLQGAEIDEITKMGAIDQTGNLLPAGKHLKKAAELLYQHPITINPAIDLDTGDIEVLRTIEELWAKHADNPQIHPSYHKLKDVLEEKSWTGRLPYPLYLLESFRLISSKVSENGELLYRLTDWGQRVLNDRKKDTRAVYATAVMALTTTRMENLSPDDNWCAISEEQGLLGKGYPTKSGRLFSLLASSIDRLPVISSIEAGILGVLPFWRGMFEQAILAKFSGSQTDQVLYGLRKLVAQALVDALPGGLYKITQAGERFKRAVSVAPSGIEFPVTPHILRLLLAAEQALENGKINWKKAERNCELDPEIFRNVILQGEKLHFIRGDKITSAGWLLIEGVELLTHVKSLWEEIEL